MLLPSPNYQELRTYIFNAHFPDCFIINCANIVLLVSSFMNNKSTLTNWLFSIQVAVMLLRKCFFLELVYDKCLKRDIIFTWQFWLANSEDRLQWRRPLVKLLGNCKSNSLGWGLLLFFNSALFHNSSLSSLSLQ